MCAEGCRVNRRFWCCRATTATCQRWVYGVEIVEILRNVRSLCFKKIHRDHFPHNGKHPNRLITQFPFHRKSWWNPVSLWYLHTESSRGTQSEFSIASNASTINQTLFFLFTFLRPALLQESCVIVLLIVAGAHSRSPLKRGKKQKKESRDEARKALLCDSI